jgi:hypothetical protein
MARAWNGGAGTRLDLRKGWSKGNSGRFGETGVEPGVSTNRAQDSTFPSVNKAAGWAASGSIPLLQGAGSFAR